MQENSKAYIILGAGGGLGSALSSELASRGHKLFLTGRNEERIASLAEEYRASYGILDASDFEATAAVFERASEELGGLDGAVNCAGSLLLKPAHRTSAEEWSEVLASNLTTAFSVVRAAGTSMRDASVVLISTAATRYGLANHDAIAAAKGGIESLVRSSAASYAAKGLRINCVAPGLVDTPLSERITSNEQSLKASVAMHALGRIGHTSDIVSAVVWFLDSQQSWVTGQTLGVDGGLGSVKSRGV